MALAGLICSASHAQNLEFSISPTPVGSGARAAGMADAFVAVADDATAASWNPAGLVQLERPEISVVGQFNAVQDDFFSAIHNEINSTHRSQSLDLNYFSFTYPLPVLVVGHNVCVSLSYQRKYDFTRKLHLKYNSISPGAGGSLAEAYYTMDYKQDGGLGALTPAVAIELTPRLSLGLSLNFWRSSFLADNGWDQTTNIKSFAKFGSLAVVGGSRIIERYEDFSAQNAALGVLWNITDKWNLGFRYDTAFGGNARYTYSEVGWDALLPSVGGSLVWPNAYALTKHETRRLNFPATAAAGVAYRPNDRLTLSLDITRTDWNDFYFTDGEGRKFSLVNGVDIRNKLTRPDFQPTTTVRFGTEYLFLPKQPDEVLKYLWSVRGGAFYDEEPASHRRNRLALIDDKGTGRPDSFTGLALGCGLLTRQRINLDLAYQIRYGNNVNKDLLLGVDGFREDAIQHRVLFSTVVYF